MSARLVTQIFPVVSCQHPEEIRVLMQRLGIVRTRTYNKLGSLKGWGLHWQRAYPIIKGIKDTQEYQLPSKLCEWTVSDVQKAISAQQEAARTEVIKKICQKYDSDSEIRSNLIKSLYSLDWLHNPWLRRQVRNAYKRGQSYVDNQIVYQSQAYTCKRVNRHTVRLEVQGLERGKRIELIVKSNRRKTENRKLARDKSEIKNLMRHGIKKMLPTPTLVYAEDLSKHFTTKKQSKAINRKLNSWMKGELQDSLESMNNIPASLHRFA